LLAAIQDPESLRMVLGSLAESPLPR